MMPAVRRLSALLGTDARETLCAGAHIYVNFLSLTRRSGWLQGHISKQSIKAPEKAADARKALVASALRHLAFAELRERDPKAVPTRDISVVWSADLLRPQLGRIRDHAEQEEAATAWSLECPTAPASPNLNATCRVCGSCGCGCAAPPMKLVRRLCIPYAGHRVLRLLRVLLVAKLSCARDVLREAMPAPCVVPELPCRACHA